VGQAPLALGALTLGATVQEMSAAYATFANDGVWREPRLYTKVYNSDGVLVVDNTQESRKILGEKAVNYMNYCLYNAATNGTGAAATFAGQNIYGKTGTTSNNRDRWFCGYTGHYTAAVWVGFDQPEQILVGTNPAALLWRKVMQPIHKGLPTTTLYNAGAFRTIAVCLDSGMLATNACHNDARGINRVAYVNVYPGDEPEGFCDKHIQMEYCYTGGGVATAYCAYYPEAVIGTASLVKLTHGEITSIRSARNVGLAEAYYSDGYVYYEGGAWTGFRSNLSNPTGAHYIECQLHHGMPSTDDYFDDWYDG